MSIVGLAIGVPAAILLAAVARSLGTEALVPVWLIGTASIITLVMGILSACLLPSHFGMSSRQPCFAFDTQTRLLFGTGSSRVSVGAWVLDGSSAGGLRFLLHRVNRGRADLSSVAPV